MPHSSASGTPIAWKNSITSRGVGAAPTFTDSTASSPSRARIFERTSSSALAARPQLVRDRLARLLGAHLAQPDVERPLVAFFFASSGSASTPASIAP